MIDFRPIKKLTIGGVELKQLFINGVQVWKGGYKNWVKYSTESDGKTIYNGGLGYKTGYRVRSGGAESASPYGLCMGFVPYTKGDILRVKPRFSGNNTTNTINFADSGFNNIGQYNDSGNMYGICKNDTKWQDCVTEENDISVMDISSISNGADIAYIRLTHYYAPDANEDYCVINPETDFIVTVNEEIV